MTIEKPAPPVEVRPPTAPTAENRLPHLPSAAEVAKQAIAQATARGIYDVVPGDGFDQSRIGDYQTRLTRTGIRYVDPDTQQEVARMPFTTDKYDPQKTYTDSREENWVVYRDENGLEVRRQFMPEIAGGSGPQPTVLEGLTPTEFEQTIKEAIEGIETNPAIITPEVIDDWIGLIDGYRGVSLAEKVALRKQLEVRLVLAGSDYQMGKQEYGKFEALFSRMGNSEKTNDQKLFDYLRDEVLQASGQAALIEMETGQGEYFRLQRGPGRPGVAKDAALINDMAQEDARVAGVAITPDHTQRAEMKLRVLKSLFNATLMSSFYTGPMNERGVLYEIQFMNVSQPPNINGLTLSPDQIKSNPSVVYYRNERYWKLKEEYRTKAGLKNLTEFLPDPAHPDRRIGDPAGSGRRLLNFPEELKRLDGLSLAGRAESLIPYAETYAMTLPQYNGKQSLRDFLDPANNDTVNKGGTFQYTGIIKGAGEAADALMALLEDPIANGEHAGDDPNKDFKPLFDVIQKFSHLKKRAPNIVSMATANIFGAVVDWNNGNSIDRKEHFPKNKKLKPESVNAAIHALSQFMEPDDQKSVGRRLRASDSDINAMDVAEQFRGIGTDIFGLFGDFLKLFQK